MQFKCVNMTNPEPLSYYAYMQANVELSPFLKVVCSMALWLRLLTSQSLKEVQCESYFRLNLHLLFVHFEIIVKY